MIAYILDGSKGIVVYDFKTGSESAYKFLPFGLALLYDIECFEEKAIISFAIHTPIFGDGLWILDANKQFNPPLTKRLLLPTFEIARDGDIIYVASPVRNHILAFNAEDLKLLRTYKSVKGVRAIDIDRENKKLYAGSFTKGKLVRIDIKTGKVEKTWDLGPAIRSIRYSPKSKRVFATSQCGIFELVDK